MTDRLLQLSTEVAVSGFEYDLAKKLQEEVSAFCDETSIDAMGNLCGIVNRGGSFRVLLEAHMDEIGLMVTGIDERGFLHFDNHCGVEEAILPAAEVWVHGREAVCGVVGVMPPHLQKKGDEKKRYEVSDLFIDTGRTADEVRKLIRVGDPISLSSHGCMLQNGVISAKSLDNRYGVYVLTELGKWAKENLPDCELTLLFAVQEEAGMRGAQAASERSNADLAMVYDVTHGTSPYVNETEGYALGSGTAIGVGPNFDRRLTKRLTDLAERHHIPFTREVMGGNTGTDAWVIQLGGMGIPCVLFSVPLRYMHTPVETLHTDDIKAALSLSKLFLTEVSHDAASIV